MKAAVLVEPGRFEIEERQMPEPQAGEVVIAIERCGICGTDIHIFHGRYAADSLPMVPGHELTGRIAALGAGVTALTEGQPVVVDTNLGCGHCYFCRRNEILNCPEMVQYGIHVDGGFAEYLCVPARLVIPTAPDLPAAQRALTEPLACVVRCARAAGVRFGQSVTVIGAGPIGNLHVQLLRTIGALPIIAADTIPARAELARAVGADIAVSRPDALVEAVRNATDGRGTDIVIESVGKAPLYALAQTLVRKGGHIAAFGLTDAGEAMQLDIVQTILEERSVGASVAGSGPDMHDALALLTHGRIDTTPFTGAEYALEQIQDAFDSFADRPGDLKTQIVMG